MSNEFVRNRIDANKSVTKALPAAGASNNSPTIDLEQTVGGIIEEIAFEIVIPALPNLADAHAVTFTVQDSADDSSYAAIDPAITTVVTGGGGVGSAAKTVRFRLPPTARRYIQLNQAVAASGGDSTAKSVSFHALF